MPLMEQDTFLEIADRLSAQYQLLVELAADLSPAALAASLTTALTGANNDLTFTAVDVGWAGNDISIEYRDPLANNQSLSITVTETDILVLLATNGGGAITSTATTIRTAINADGFASDLVTAALAPSNSGAGVVTAMAKTNLAGATHGLFGPIITKTNNPDIEDNLTLSAVNLDTLLTAPKIAQSLTVMTQMVTTLRSHFSVMGQAGVIDGFLEDNEIRVHANFDILHSIATSTHLKGANVFFPDILDVAIITLSNGSAAVLTLQPTGAKASLLVDPPGANNDTLFTAVAAGISGNAISVAYVDPTSANQPLWVEVEGKNITVHLATDGSSVITSLASQVRAAVNANTAAAALVLAAASGLETGVVTAKPIAYLTNRNTSLTYTAVDTGAEGTDISVTYVDPAAASQALAVTVVGKAISVSLATNGSSVITSTADDVYTAVTGSTAAAALVGVTKNGTTTGVVSAVAATKLIGGVLAPITDPTPLGSGEGLAGTENYAAQLLNISVTPSLKSAYTDLYPSDSFAILDIDTVGTNNKLRFKAITGGVGGNDITIELVYSQRPSVTASVLVTGTDIQVTLATDAGSVITSTANAIKALVNADVNANVLVEVTSLDAGTGVMGSRWTQSNLDNTRTKVKFTAVTPGFAGESIRVRYVDPAAINQAESVSVASNDITVNLATDANGDITSTPATIIASVTGSGPAAALVVAAQPGSNPTDGPVAAVGYTPLDAGSGPNLKRTTLLRLSLERSDLTSVTRDVNFPAGSPPDTVVEVGSTAASLTLTPISTVNATLKFTAVTPGIAGNSITIEYLTPTIPNSPLSVVVNGTAIKVNLQTSQAGSAVSTADEVKNAVNGDGSASALVTVTNVNWGFGYVAAVAATPLASGAEPERYYECTAVSVLEGGEGGDVFTINQVVEREFSM